MGNNAGYRGRRSKTPDIALPTLKNKNWCKIYTALFVDESLNDSGAAIFCNGMYQPQLNAEGIDTGLALTNPVSAAQIQKIIQYDKWITSLIEQFSPEVVVGESHPFARGSIKTSNATLDVMTGIRYITMLA